MYFKQAIANVSKEIIKLEKELHLENGWEHLQFTLEQIYHWRNLVLSVKESSNYQKKVEMDLEDLKKQFPNEEEEQYDIWVISDHILEYIDNQGYETN